LVLGFVLSSVNDIAAPQMIPRIIVLIISTTMIEGEKVNDPYQSRYRYNPMRRPSIDPIVVPDLRLRF
jgi:hypothetical protein